MSEEQPEGNDTTVESVEKDGVTMPKMLLLDFSRILLFPKDADYSGSLNALY